MIMQEAKGYLEHMLRTMAVEPPENLTDIRDIKEWEDEHSKVRDTLEISLSAIEELEKYRALGTVEELKEAREFKKYFDELYGEGLEVANWHKNGDLEPFDSFYESALEFDWSDADDL
jgi:hypothetical protein